ncbi:MAG: P-loop NTPase, partial [Planctomycetales bacterium]|nr:P-loop NTPase [Planctomycetales bacterium]
ALSRHYPAIVDEGREVLERADARLEDLRIQARAADKTDYLAARFREIEAEERSAARPRGAIVFNRERLDELGKAIQGSVKVEQAKDPRTETTELITVAAEQDDRIRARDIVEAVIGAYQVFSSEMNEEPLRATENYIEGKLRAAAEELQKLDGEITRFRQEKEIFSSTIQGQTHVQNLMALESEKRAAQLRLDEVRSQLERLAQQKIPYDAPHFANLRIAAEDPVASIETRIRELEIERERLRSRYTDSWPEVQAVDAGLGVLRKLLADKEKARTEQILSLSKLILESQGDVLEKALKRLEEPIREEQNRLKDLSRNDATLVQLEAKRGAVEKELQDLQVKRTSAGEKLVSQRRAVQVQEPPADGIPVPRRSAWPLALLVAAFMSLVAAYLAEYLSTAIRTEHDVRRYLNLPVVGRVPSIPEGEERMLMTLPPKDPLAEIFASAMTLVQSLTADRNARVFLVASYRPGEGKSTVAANLSIAASRLGYRVALVDADMRKPSAHRFFGLDNTEGLSTVLSGRVEAQATLARTLGGEATAGAAYAGGLGPLLRETGIEGLRVLPSGPSHHNPLGLLRSEFTDSALRDLRELADLVIVDVPPVGGAVETLVLAPRVDGIVLVISAGTTTKEEATEAKRLIENARGKIVGVVLNHATYESRGYYYYTVSKYYRGA